MIELVVYMVTEHVCVEIVVTEVCMWSLNMYVRTVVTQQNVLYMWLQNMLYVLMVVTEVGVYVVT